MGIDIQKKIYGYEDLFSYFQKLELNNKLPNKFIISGKKGIGKSSFAYHLINYLFTTNEEYKYDTVNLEINELNRSFKLIQNLSHPNFYLIDVDEGKENIGIEKIRKCFEFINRSSMNGDRRIVLIDNIEYLNINSINALLKVIEEPNEKLIFILIHNSSYKLLDTLKSRCILFKKNFSEKEVISIFDKLSDENYVNLFHGNTLARFMTVGELLFLKEFCEENQFKDKLNTNNILHNYFSNQKNKYDKKYYSIITKLIQIYLYEKNLNSFSESTYTWYKSFFKKFAEAKKFNLDIGNLFFEFNTKVLNE